MKSKSGFTIVEVVVTIVIIAILASITVVAYTKVQQDSRDSVRKGNVTVIAEAMEEYYGKNGEYPSVRSVANNFVDNTGTVVAAKLGINVSALKMPKMPSSATNALFSSATPSNDYIAYIGNSAVNNNNCQNVLAGGCDEFTMKYAQESGTIVTVESRHKGRPAGAPTTPGQAAAPTLAASQSGTNVVATATADPCEATLVAKFSFHYRVNAGAWSTYSTWDASTTYTVPGTQGNTYDFQAVTRCDNSSVPGVTSPESAIVSYQYPITTPSTPTVTVTLSGSNALATATAVSCPAGTTANYAFRSRVNDGTWSSYSAWSTTLTSSQAASQGFRYGYMAKSRCQLGSVNSDEATGAEATYTRPITTPSAPTVSHTTSGSITTWTTSGTCPAGTNKEWQEQDSADWGYTSSWYGPYDSTFTGSGWDTSSQGYQFTEAFQVRCKTSYVTSSWSTSGATSYIRPITAPGAPINYVASQSADHKAVNWVWTAPSCYGSLQNQDTRTASWPPGSYGAWTAQGWWSASWTQTIVSNGQPIVIPSGSQFRIKAQYICVNTTTGRQSAWGPIGESPIYTAP
jgi:prepilin-type N-terminal cleavage/methylation domain-containing protein